MSAIQERLSRSVIVMTMSLAGCAAPSLQVATPPSTTDAPPSTATHASPSPQPAADVPLFRGDAGRTGLMPGPAPSTEPDLRWEFAADGAIHSAQAIGGGLVFVASEAGTLFAVDMASSEVMWQVTLGGIPTSPALTGGSVIVGASSGRVFAFDRATGEPSWAIDIGSPILGAPDLVEAGVIITASDGTVSLLDPSDGRSLWTTPLDGLITRSPAVWQDLIVVPLDPGKLAAIDLGSGRIRWQTSVAEAGSVGSPAVDGTVVVAATGLGGSASSRGVVALDPATGSVMWRYRSPTDRTVYTPALAGDRAYVIGEDGVVVALDTATGQQVWAIQLDEKLEALPAVVGGTLVVAGNDGHLRALNVDDGSEIWSVPIEGVPFAPAVTGGLVLVPSDRGTVSAYGAPE